MQINEKIKNFNKYQKILCVLLAIILILAVISIISMNKKPKSLEKYIKSHPSTQREIEKLNKSDVQMTVEKNTIIYKYDTKKVLGDKNFDDFAKNSLQESLGSKEAEKNCKLQISNIEDKTGIKGIKVKMIYMYDGNEVASKTY